MRCSRCGSRGGVGKIELVMSIEFSCPATCNNPREVNCEVDLPAWRQEIGTSEVLELYKQVPRVEQQPGRGGWAAAGRTMSWAGGLFIPRVTIDVQEYRREIWSLKRLAGRLLKRLLTAQAPLSWWMEIPLLQLKKNSFTDGIEGDEVELHKKKERRREGEGEDES
jgi:hypothetical protein